MAYRSSIHGIFQARILAISFSRRSSWPRDWTRVSRIVGGRFTVCAPRWEYGVSRLSWNVAYSKSSVNIRYDYFSIKNLFSFISCQVLTVLAKNQCLKNWERKVRCPLISPFPPLRLSLLLLLPSPRPGLNPGDQCYTGALRPSSWQEWRKRTRPPERMPIPGQLSSLILQPLPEFRSHGCSPTSCLSPSCHSEQDVPCHSSSTEEYPTCLESSSLPQCPQDEAQVI